jgi:hypothetical protein
MKDRSVDDKAKSLGRREDLEAREDQLDAPRIVRLTAFVKKLRAKTRKNIPFFDPWDGGTAAEVLFLFETPGRRANKSGFVSRNNPDPSANNFFRYNEDERVPRTRTLSWNIVPWYIGSKSKIRSATANDCEKGIPQLIALLKLLPRLRVIVFFGKKA